MVFVFIQKQLQNIKNETILEVPIDYFGRTQKMEKLNLLMVLEQ